MLSDEGVSEGLLCSADEEVVVDGEEAISEEEDGEVGLPQLASVARRRAADAKGNSFLFMRGESFLWFPEVTITSRRKQNNMKALYYAKCASFLETPFLNVASSFV